MKKGLLIAAALIVVAAVAAPPLAERYVAGKIKAEIERDGQGTVDRVDVGLFDRRVTLANLKTHAFGELTARRWEVSGLSVSLGDLFEGRMPFLELRSGDPLRAARVEVTDAQLVDPGNGASWSVASLVIEGFDLGRYNPVAAGPASSSIMAARIASALAVHRVEAKKLAYVVPVTGDTLGVRRIEVEAVDHGKIGTISLLDVEATPKAATQESFKVAEIKARDLDLGRIVGRLEAGSWTPGQPLGRLELGSARASGFGGLVLSQYGVSLDAVSLETSRQSLDSSRSRFRIDGLTLRAGLDLEAAKLGILLQAMGLRELALGFDCVGDERRGKGELALNDCVLTAADLGNLSLDAHFVNADAAFWRAVDDGNPFGIERSAIALGSAKLAVVDKGMIERVVRAVAAATRQAPAATRAKLAQDIRSYQPPDVLITEGLTKLLETVARFVEQGGTLLLEAKPEPPLRLEAASRLSRSGPDLVSLFGLSATLGR